MVNKTYQAQEIPLFPSPLEVDRFISAGEDDTYRLIYEFPSPLEVHRFISVEILGDKL